MANVGIDIGALTVKVVALGPDGTRSAVEAHQGRPAAAIERVLARPEFSDAEFFGVCGRAGDVADVAAIQRALRESDGDFDAVAALGGESFLVYVVTGGRVANVLSHNKCAAGSGEFLVQQVGRMGLGIDEAIRRSAGGAVVPLASRCSVHCKSDITHKLNRKEAAPEDILRTLHDGMADKVVALLDRARCALRRVLVIGGVSRNAALLAALREKLPATEFVVGPWSAVFEAWGCALLVRDAPRDRSPRIAQTAEFSTLPPLARHAGLVRVIAAPPRQAPPGGPLVLGIDAGSTTTKAVLVDPATRAVVASHYARTSGDPVQAARGCLRALAAQVGDVAVATAGTTGSARELVAAYLGTGHAVNEISAHAAGAAHFDPEVDTIFEIGGQDAKYVRLANGVPVDYAMNNACSAGTGSFLEESAQGDLGIGVSEIAAVAEAAAAPVHFKSTCAAFINSDVRIAMEQGRSRDDVAAGLVYAVAANYLTKVKGPRSVGRRVFLQGGVALNHALANAFAHGVGRPVVVPPDPELLGALGVALLTLRDAAPGRPAAGRLLALAAREIRVVGRFTCGACGMRCGIDRFEVDGRRFPFGGRCSLFESVWKRAARTAAAPDLVEARAAIVLGSVPAAAAPGARRIGVPRALTTHALFPLYATFLSRLSLDVVLSGVDPRGDLKSNSAFCFPAQVAHGAVLDLVRRGVDLVFLPHVSRMPRTAPCRDSFLCPVAQAGPYVLAKAFPGVRVLSPLLDLSGGYAACGEAVDAAVRDLGFPRAEAERAWAAAVLAQDEAERAMRAMGQRALEDALRRGGPVIVLAGRSYNAFAPEGSQSVGKKLASMGVTVVPADCVAPVEAGPTSWHYANQLLNAVALARRHPEVFLLCVSNFSCTLDAFTHARVASEMGAKPYLVLEIDAHTADAGVQTRLEAFLDIVAGRASAPAAAAEAFVPCRLDARGRVVRPDGTSLPMTDPRVRVSFPNFSHLHAQAMAAAARWTGLHPGDVVPLDRRQLDRGLRHTSGRECLPLPICIGQMLEAHERRAEGEVTAFYTIRGGAPCVADAYMDHVARFIAEERLPDLVAFAPGADNDWCGVDPAALARHTTSALLAADLLHEVEQTLRVAGAPGALARFRRLADRFLEGADSLDAFHAGLPRLVDEVAALPRRLDPAACPRVMVTGDFFTRFDPFFMEGVGERYARRGIVLEPVGLSELLLYGLWDSVADVARRWRMRPGGLAFATACARFRTAEGRAYLSNWLAYRTEQRTGRRYRAAFARTGLVRGAATDTAAAFERAQEHVSPAICGEVIPTVGSGLDAADGGYDGMIVVGPFNCLPFRISEALLKPLSIRGGMPILTYESDGCAVPASVLRQVDVHVQQVLERSERRAALVPA